MEVRTWAEVPFGINAVVDAADWYGICDAEPPAKLATVVTDWYVGALVPLEVRTWPDVPGPVNAVVPPDD